METHNNTLSSEGNTPVKKDSPKSAQGETTLMGILAYLGPLVFVSYLVARDNSFVKFHIKQGLVLFVIEVVLWILNALVPVLGALLSFIGSIALLVFIIVGIVNVVRRLEKKLPVVGDYDRYFPI